MGMLDWFKSIVRGGGNPQAPGAGGADDKGAELAGLNFKTAVDAHMKWKIRLESYINGTSTEQLNVDVVCRDDQCTLGQWIGGIGGERFGQMPVFAVVRSRHAHFHRCAGEVLAVAQQGDKARALHMLEEGAYPDASEQVAEAIVHLFAGQKAAA
ncbi:MAG: CZB domain-containing protein [Rhodocyclaceae bacterium]|nr:CZB domain-containing protein [Rhodocyclaceae bacterium]